MENDHISVQDDLYLKNNSNGNEVFLQLNSGVNSLSADCFDVSKRDSNWMDWPLKSLSPIEPPLQFQDSPYSKLLEDYCDFLTGHILNKVFEDIRNDQLKQSSFLKHLSCTPHHLCHRNGGAKASLSSSRFSSSHNSLSALDTDKTDDSNFITQAVSHDTLTSSEMRDLYNVPFDSDTYAVPLDVVQQLSAKKSQNHPSRRRRRNTFLGYKEVELKHSNKKRDSKQQRWCTHKEPKRHSLTSSSTHIEAEPIHMTLQEVRQYLNTLYSSSSDSENKEKTYKSRANGTKTGTNKIPANSRVIREQNCVINGNGRLKKNSAFLINIKNKKVKDSCDNDDRPINISQPSKSERRKKVPARFISFKQALCSLFTFKKFLSSDVKCSAQEKKCFLNNTAMTDDTHSSIVCRALPPLPFGEEKEEKQTSEEPALDFATSIQRVKDYGWYWGPLPSEVAEKVLSNEPDGSFIVRDSSDDHYIFSLTFKLNDCVRHVRIDHDQGNFSFGNCTKFKSQTIVEFIENAVEHSRSGRYLFFLHRRPVIGPVRVQLLHPVSRFKQVQSLQHICRFVIHKSVRRDLISSLPLPRRMIDYLNTPHYYSEHVVNAEDANGNQVPPRESPSPRQFHIPGSNFNSAIQHLPVTNYIVLNNVNSS